MSRGIRPFTDTEYTLLVLQGLKRMIRRTDIFRGFVPPRNFVRENADSSEVEGALEYAIALVSAQHSQEQMEQYQRNEENDDRAGD
jgi:hypothetical protein